MIWERRANCKQRLVLSGIYSHNDKENNAHTLELFGYTIEILITFSDVDDRMLRMHRPEEDKRQSYFNISAE